MRKGLGRIAGLACALALWAGSQAHAGGVCQRVELIDADTGAAIQGTEDIVLDVEGDRLFVSAYDRWAVEDAVAAGAPALPQGGIYSVALDDLTEPGERLVLENLAAEVRDALHPHGIGFYHGGDTRRLVAVNHAYRRADGKWRRKTRLDLYAVEETGLSHDGGIESPRLCRVNDVIPLSGGDFLFTREYGACAGARRWAEMVFGLRHAEVGFAALDEDGGHRIETLLDDFGLANGLAVSPDGRMLAVAGTRERRVRFYDLVDLLAGSGEEALRTAVELDGGPDNLGWSEDGRLLAAVHPSLIGSGMARYRWLGRDRAGSRVVAIDARSGESEVLVDDQDGEMLNMATSATAAGDILVAAGVLDSALLVCRTAETDHDAQIAGGE